MEDLPQEKYLSNRERFPCLHKKHERGWENSRQLPRILPNPRVFISGYVNTERKISTAFIKKTFPGKREKHFVQGTD